MGRIFEMGSCFSEKESPLIFKGGCNNVNSDFGSPGPKPLIELITPAFKPGTKPNGEIGL